MANKKPARRRAAPKGGASAEPAVRPPRAKRGRPSLYSQALADRVCKAVAEGQTLRQVCRTLELPESTVRGWALSEEHPFFAQYARARELGLWSMADDMVLISDDAEDDWKERINQKGEKYIAYERDNVRRSHLRVESRKWLMAKLLPAFKDKVSVEGSPEKPIQVTHDVAGEFISRIAGIAARLGTSKADQPAK